MRSFEKLGSKGQQYCAEMGVSIVRGRVDKGFHPRFINEQELKDWKKISWFSLMNQLGNDGWELVSSVGYLTGTYYYDNELLFKRPKP